MAKNHEQSFVKWKYNVRSIVIKNTKYEQKETNQNCQLFNTDNNKD